jgi:predicted nuclease with TOPRIM domain
MMTFSIILGSALAFFVTVFRALSRHRYTTLIQLNNERQEMDTLHQSLSKQKRELQRERTNKEQTLCSLKNKRGDIPTVTVDALEALEMNENDKISRYLLGRGKISMEQHERAIQKMNILKMDYLSVCLTLGFIDLETSKKVQKASKANIPSR